MLYWLVIKVALMEGERFTKEIIRQVVITPEGTELKASDLYEVPEIRAQLGEMREHTYIVNDFVAYAIEDGLLKEGKGRVLNLTEKGEKAVEGWRYP